MIIRNFNDLNKKEKKERHAVLLYGLIIGIIFGTFIGLAIGTLL